MGKRSPAPKWKRPTECRVCGRSDVPISRRGLCEDDAVARMTQGTTEMALKQGDAWESWKASMREAASRL